MRPRTAREWADLLVDNVSTVTQVRELPYVGDWRCNAKSLFELAMNVTGQTRVAAWILDTLGEESSTNGPERTLRLVEEAVELAQAVGVEREALHRLVDYVFERPAGEPAKEIAGCLVTLYGAASALGVDAQAELEKEIVRIRQPEVMERVRRRQAEKRSVTRRSDT